MVPWLCFGLALAAPTDPLPRAAEPLTQRDFARLVGEGPAWGYGRRRHGAVTAWIFPDGVVEHAEIRKGRTLSEVRHYDAGGRPWTTTIYEDGQPKTVQVHRPTEATVDVSAWSVRHEGGWVLRWPPETGSPWLSLKVVPSTADPRSDAFREGLAEACGCLLEDRTTAWIEGRPGVRYRVRVPDPDRPWTGDLWAFSSGDHALLLASLVPARPDSGPEDGPVALAVGRAVVALARREEAK